MHVHIYIIQYLCGGEKTKGDLLHLKILSGGSDTDHLRLLSQQHLWAAGVRALMCLNKWQPPSFCWIALHETDTSGEKWAGVFICVFYSAGYIL